MEQINWDNIPTSVTGEQHTTIDDTLYCRHNDGGWTQGIIVAYRLATSGVYESVKDASIATHYYNADKDRFESL